MSKHTIFTGAGVAIVTPFCEDGIDYESFASLIEKQIANHTDAIVVCGTTGEASTMPNEEHIDAIRFAVRQVAGRVPVIAGTGSNDTLHSVYLSCEAKKAGADALLLVTPYYNKTTQKGLLRHFREITKAANLPAILYNIPSRTGMKIAVETMAELAKLDEIVAVKEASGDISYTASVAAACPELDIYSGNDDMIVPILSLGGKGVISVLSNIMPQETHDICQKYFDGDVAGSRDLQLKLLPLIHALFCEVNPIPVKTALNLMGENAGKLRLPLDEMEEKNLVVLKTAMQENGLI